MDGELVSMSSGPKVMRSAFCTHLEEVSGSLRRPWCCWLSNVCPAAVEKSSSKVTRPAKLSTVTICSGPTEASPVINSKDCDEASGLDIVERRRAKTRFHSVGELERRHEKCISRISGENF